MSWWRDLLGQNEKPSHDGKVSEPPLIANPGKRARPPLAGGMPPDDVTDEVPDKSGTVRTIHHIWCDGKTCSHD
jgi:hypothetical protein